MPFLYFFERSKELYSPKQKKSSKYKIFPTFSVCAFVSMHAHCNMPENLYIYYIYLHVEIKKKSTKTHGLVFEKAEQLLQLD